MKNQVNFQSTCSSPCIYIIWCFHLNNYQSIIPLNYNSLRDSIEPRRARCRFLLFLPTSVKQCGLSDWKRRAVQGSSHLIEITDVRWYYGSLSLKLYDDRWGTYSRALRGRQVAFRISPLYTCFQVASSTVCWQGPSLGTTKLAG